MDKKQQLSNTATPPRVVNEYPEQDTGLDLKGAALGVGWLIGIVFGVVILAIIFAWGSPVIHAQAGAFMTVLLWGGLGVLALFLLSLAVGRHYRMVKEEYRKTFNVTQKFAANENGDYPALWLPSQVKFEKPTPGTPKQVCPQTFTYSPEVENRNDATVLTKLWELMDRQQAPSLGTGTTVSELTPLPRIEPFYDIKYNSLQTGMGIAIADGKLIWASLDGDTHFKNIGGSGLGKSCLTAAMIDIATTTNDPDHLRIGILDLEHNTSRLFEDLPHIAEIGPKKQRLVGTDPDDVALKLQLCRWELARREGLGEAWCKVNEPLLLIYIEEMLSLKYEVDPKLKKDMLAAINILGLRARKYRMKLLVNMNTDYSDKSTREAMAQFRTRSGFAIDPDTARASGFYNLELVKDNFLQGRKGQYVLEKPQYNGLVLAPDYDVALKLEQLSGITTGATTNVKHVTTTRRLDSRVEVGMEEALEVALVPPLPSAPQAVLEGFSPQELRYIHKFRVERMGISKIVASEHQDTKGQPLKGGREFLERSAEVQAVLRRYVDVKEASWTR